MSRPETIQQYHSADYPYEQDLQPGYAEAEPEYYAEEQEYPDYYAAEQHSGRAPRKNPVDAWMNQESKLLRGVTRRKIALVLIGALAFVPILFTLRGWISLNEKNSLTNTEADVLGTGGELTFLLCVTVTPLVTLTGQRWFVPLRRWMGIMFVFIGTADSITASITGDFAGGPIGRVAGHTFLLSGLFIILMGLVVVSTSSNRMQRALGKHWKSVQRVTYLIWFFIFLHLILLDGFHTFNGQLGDGIPFFHHRAYQFIAVSLPLVALRLPPIRRWVVAQREAGQQWKVWAAMMPLMAMWLIAMLFIFNEEINTGMKILTMNPPGN